MEFEDFASTTEFKVVAKQLAALSAQDERIAEYFRLIDKGEKPTGNPLEIVGNVPVGMNINFNDFASAVETKLWDKIGKINWRPFKEAREWARAQKPRSQKEWFDLAKTDIRPADIPIAPSQYYSQNGWISWGDWLGSGYIATIDREYRDYNEAKIFAQSKNLSSGADWYDSASRDLPSDIPRNVAHVYSSEWESWGDFLGTGSVSNSRKVFHSFGKSKALVKAKKFKNVREFDAWENKPDEIPKAPDRTYVLDWQGWPDFLGLNKVRPGKKVIEPRSFEQARDFARSLGLRRSDDWKVFSKSSDKPFDIPATPNEVYKNKGWKNFPDWLGTETLPFEEARAYARTLQLTSSKQWKSWAKSNLRPYNIPRTPEGVYKDQGWGGFPDWLGLRGANHGQREYLSYEEARKFVGALGLESNTEWRVWSASGQRPVNIPGKPALHYKGQGWNSWTDFLQGDK
jgi:hypothetical protein